jgi:acetyl/propionyl-CoA carboxylase alpha subunit
MHPPKVAPRTRSRSAGTRPWREAFPLDHVKVLIAGRGPVRKEAIEAFAALGAQPSGILLSEKDSVVYPRALAPELRLVGRDDRVHRIPDYAGANAAEKATRIAQIIEIARKHRYTHVFAGYGFMAEDHEFIRAIEQSGLGFVGPSSRVAVQAGAKDAAKKAARSVCVSVTPGVDNIAALTLLAKAEPGQEAAFLDELVRRHGLDISPDAARLAPAERAELVLRSAQGRGVELILLADLQREAEKQVQRLLAENPGRKLRFKHVGGGGGKGQRVIASLAEVPQAVFEVLNESKATGPGDNKNFLIELNIENTRHNEIQLLGNGEWCIALGGRDCSLQMHEQKLTELSIHDEMLQAAAERYEQAGKRTQAAVLREDLSVLREMEAQAERFGEAVRLDSASTFESIVSGNQHYFMEMNTRIQVEHRVTEMVYALRFSDPADPGQYFDLDSLVGAMLLVSAHGERLPRPTRRPRHGSGLEVRINATNDALRPHAGGMILDWTPPLADELRDDQGIGVPNPDTGQFMPYRLAGAYDSNAALIVTHGRDREDNLRRMLEILRHSEIRGDDVQTNQPFHYGLIHWMLGCDAMIKPATLFARMYVAAVGSLAEQARELDLDAMWQACLDRTGAARPQALPALSAKQTLLLRPLKLLLARPHLLAGWLAPRPVRRWEVTAQGADWRQNPLDVLSQLYRYLSLEERPGATPEEQIWEHDRRLLDEGLAFYHDLAARAGARKSDWASLSVLLAGEVPPRGLEAGLWERARAAHRGFQLGLELLKLPILIGHDAGFFGLTIDERLEPVVPAGFADPQESARLHAVLAPPPAARSNQIVAWTGGTFYARPEPGADPYVKVGRRVAAGETVGILEVMKMFNPIRAEAAGTIRRQHVEADGGVLVAKGQLLFELELDHPVAEESEDTRAARRRERGQALLERLWPQS